MKKLFTERQGGTKPRVVEALDDTTRRGLLALVSARIDEEWLGLSYPFQCQDGYGNAGTDVQKLRQMVEAYGVLWPEHDQDEQSPPTDGQVFDLIEFMYEFVAEPTERGNHSYWGHTHYTYDRGAGRQKFQEDVNRIFERNGIAFELRDGEVVRIGPVELHESLAKATFNTGDSILDELLGSARQKFLNRSLDVRCESLEKLWDAWERLKTVEPGGDKKTQARALLDKSIPEPNFRDRIERDARELTEIGNRFMIRHTETDKIPIADSAQVDYLFQRMFVLIRLLLRASGRGG